METPFRSVHCPQSTVTHPVDSDTSDGGWSPTRLRAVSVAAR